MKAWLKGGLIVLGLDFLFWLIMFIGALFSSSDIAGLAVIAVLFYGLISLIPAFLIGALIGLLSGKTFSKEKKLINKWSIIGLIIGIIWPSVWYLYVVIAHSLSLFSELSFFVELFQYPFVVVYLLSIVVCAWILWIVGGLIKK